MIHLSVVIPCYGSLQVVADCLRSIRGQSMPHYEIILVVSGLEDISECLSYGGPDLRILHSKDRLFAGQARNWGARVAKYNVLAFIDADCRVQTGWGWTALRGIEKYHALTGPKFWVNSQSDFIKAFHLFEFHEFTSLRPRRPRFLDSGNLVIRREFFHEIGGFNESLPNHQDFYFLKPVPDVAKFEIYYDPSMAVQHFSNAGIEADLRVKAEWLGETRGRLENKLNASLSIRMRLLKKAPVVVTAGIFLGLIGFRLFCLSSMYRWIFHHYLIRVGKYCYSWAKGLKRGLNLEDGMSLR